MAWRMPGGGSLSIASVWRRFSVASVRCGVVEGSSNPVIPDGPQASPHAPIGVSNRATATEGMRGRNGRDGSGSLCTAIVPR